MLFLRSKADSYLIVFGLVWWEAYYDKKLFWLKKPNTFKNSYKTQKKYLDI